ncbi:MAG: NAD(P)H:quinone oxidoreductase [Arenicella sp.]
MAQILVVYHSRLGSVQAMADLISRGVASVTGCEAILRTVPKVASTIVEPEPAIPASGPPYVTLEELSDCDGLLLGSPTRFGNMSAEMKFFLDSTSKLWMSGALSGKPAAVFSSSSSMHGGQESTLLSMMNPLLHHGMIISGIPYSEPALAKTTTGGTPYGATHVAGSNNNQPISDDEKALCLALGKRVASLAQKLKN